MCCARPAASISMPGRAAAYWTHYGPGDWYLDAVAQATRYQGAASTQFAGLATTGFGFVTSLEAGYPIRLPMFGPGFVLEPQAQVVWQRVSFDDANDGLGEVALGTTSGASGRIGLRGRWTIVSDSGQVWQPYVRANLWRDWGAQATTTYSGVDLVPLLEQANRLQLGGGLSVRMNAMSASTPMPTTSSPSATPTAAGATASAEPLGCDIHGEYACGDVGSDFPNFIDARRGGLHMICSVSTFARMDLRELLVHIVCNQCSGRCQRVFGGQRRVLAT